jgi:hypothetical protein
MRRGGRLLVSQCSWPPFSPTHAWSRASSTTLPSRWSAPTPANRFPTVRARFFSSTAGHACACCVATWPTGSTKCSRPVTVSRSWGAAILRSWPGAHTPRSRCVCSTTTTRPAASPKRSSSSRAPGVPRGRSARLCALRDWSRVVGAGSPGSRRRSPCSRARRRSWSTQRRGPSWEPRFGGRTAARRRASSFGPRWS